MLSLMTNQLCYLLCEISQRIAKDIEQARNLGLSYQEETITETALLSLKNQCPAVCIRAFTRHEEAKNGADWEWWVGSGQSWLGMRVQAKKKRTNGPNIQGIQTYRTKSHSMTQIDVLLAAAQKDKLNPIYCLYVGGGNHHNSAMSRGTCVGQMTHGSFIAHASKVKATQSNDWNDICKVAYPWHMICCDCCMPTAGPVNSGSTTAAFRLYKLLAEKNDEKSLLFEPGELPDYMSQFETNDKLLQRAAERKLRGFVLVDLAQH